MIVINCLDEYFELMIHRPELFADSDEYPIVRSRDIIEKFQINRNIRIGVLYMSAYHMLIVDLICKDDNFFAYERIVPVALNNGVVCVPVIGEKFLLLKQDRHAIRDTQICFPRGFGENGILPMENAKKELFEEIGMMADECTFLGKITPDSGLSSSECDVFLCRINETAHGFSVSEGIKAVISVSAQDLSGLISKNQINDSFTLSAFSLLKVKGLI